MRIIPLAVLVSFSTFLASAAGPGAAESVSDVSLLLRLLESGSVGVSFAAAMVLAVRWLATHLLAAKDEETKRWRETAEKNAADSAANAATMRELAREMVSATRDLCTTLERLETSATHRALMCAQAMGDMKGAAELRPKPPGS